MLSPLELVEQARSESLEYEFKRELPGRDDRAKSELLKDVCALANSGGGFIYYGIEEECGSASRIVPISDENFDAASRRIGQILDGGIEPRLRDVRIENFLVDGGYVLVLRISPSFNMPHRMIANGHSKFMVRNATHVAEMSFDQIRQAFLRNGSLITEARNRWASEIERVRQRRTWRPIINGPVCIVQFTPISAMERIQIVDLSRVHADFSRFMFEDWGGASRTFNLDGIVIYPGGRDGEVGAFSVVGRDGSLTIYRSAKIISSEDSIIPSRTIAEFFRNSYFKFAKFSNDYAIPGPYVVNTAIIGVGGYGFGLGQAFFMAEPKLADREDLIFPEQYFETIFAVDDERCPKVILDMMWQSFGIASCTYYDDEGHWSFK